ncbi:MAG: hypothetical protein WCG64_08115 [Flavobacteriia bacterium]
MRSIQRFISVLIIFAIWMFVFSSIGGLVKNDGNESIPVPKQTVGAIKISPKKIFGNVLFDFSFRNKDPKILKIVSEYYQNFVQDTNAIKIPIDFKQNFTLLKIKHHSKFVWMVGGKLKETSHTKDFNGFTFKGFYYEIISPEAQLTNNELKTLFKRRNTIALTYSTEPIEYALLNQGKSENIYEFALSERKITIQFVANKTALFLKKPTEGNYFQISSAVNKGSILPKKYQNLRELSENINSFSLNYFGADYIQDDENPSFFDAKFDLVLNFSKKTKVTDLESLLKNLTDEEITFSQNRLNIGGARYLVKQINDSSIYIGKHAPKLKKSIAAFSLNGNPKVLTEVRNLGWRGSVLELIPEYRALVDFSNSIENVKLQEGPKKNAIEITFKKDNNARMETFRFLLTLANAYQFTK